MGQALYRKYRSKSLAEIVGQEHVTTTLANALKAGRVSHAYLLTGPRGVGKTSIARILAHEINGLPYGDEAHLDIIEIDAASNRRIDEIRDLRDRVNTAPSAAKYKVYIIDEVHMLTKEAFNALLKTLEEPPAHVVFILATTEAHKLPETIVSRTQRYTLRPVPQDQVITHLRTIAGGEKLQIDDEALGLIAQHGEGSFRDSISLLDQASSIAKHVTRADVERILGLAPDEQIGKLLAAVTGGDSSVIVTTLADIYAQGYEAAMVAHQLGAYLRQTILEGQAADPQATLTLLKQLLDVPGARSPKQLLELVLLQSALPTAPGPVTSAMPATAPPATSTPVPAPVASTPRLAPTPVIEPAERPKPAAKPAPTEPPKSTGPKAESAAPAATNPATDTPPETAPETPPAATLTEVPADITELWQQTLEEIKRQYNTLYGIARMARPGFDGDKLTLAFKFAFHQKRLQEAKNRKIFADVFERLYGQPVEIVCVVAEAGDGGVAGQGATGTPDVATISNIFGGAELLQ
jgi:DNA polymerase-3 subunit gamma/tau